MPPDLAPRLLTLLSAAVVVAALVLAANALLVSGRLRRQAGVGLFAITMLAVAGLYNLEDNKLFQPRIDNAIWNTYHPAEAAEIRAYFVLPPLLGSAPERVRLMLSQDVADGGTGVLAALVPEGEHGIRAVSGPPSWTFNPWEGESDWFRAIPALYATLLLAGLVTLVTAMFPPRPHRFDECVWESPRSS
ncbi:hypothetical protein Adi01nite_76170 [Amorphoplanes digitatis]|nr:hypothetical protein Adi01nite_76170 [Actinoplanes digitatis]